MLIIDKALRERAGSGRPGIVGARQTAKQMLRSILPRTVTLDGAVETIARCRPRIQVEIEEHLSPGGLARAKGFFSGFGYRGYYAHGDRLENIEKFSPTEMKNLLNRVALTAMLRERLQSTGYVNNFIFLPCGEPQATVDRLGERLARM